MLGVAVLCDAVLGVSCTVPCCAVLGDAVLCYAMPCWAWLSSSNLVLLQGEFPLIAIFKDNKAYEQHVLQPKEECLPPWTCPL